MLDSLVAALFALAPLAPAVAGEGAAKPVIGDVIAVDVAARRLTVKPDAGAPLLISVPATASVVRAAPGASGLAGAVALPFDWIAVGDRVLARQTSGGPDALEARQLVVMSRSDLERKQAAERADWLARGVLGVVASLDSEKGEIAVRAGRRPDAANVVVSTAGRSVAFRRYAPDSVKFSDARPSSLAELKVGDELRALGDRGPDGALLAERIVFGSFRSVSGSVTGVDLAKGEVTIQDESRKRLTVSVSADTRLRRLPAETGGWRRAGPGAPEDLLERLPPLALAELKVGERVLVSSAEGSDPARLNAIALVAGLAAPGFAPGAGRASRGDEAGLPPELLDLGMSLP